MGEDRKLLMARYRRWMEALTPEQRKKPTLFSIGGGVYSPEDVLREIERGTRMGKVFEEAERKLLQRTMEKKRRAGL